MNNTSEKNYLSSKDAGAILGYTHDYISRLCRQGKMSGLQKGREWFVTMEEIELFKMRHEVELAEKKKELSKKFSHIRKEAEAKKRKAREQSVPQSIPTEFFAAQDAQIKQVTFQFPKQLAAALVLFLCVMIPSFVTSSKDSLQSFTYNFEQGIVDTIYTQSTIVEPTASVFKAMPQSAELFVSSISTLPYQTYVSLRAIGEGYLVVYLLQGEALYYSFQNLNSIGATVLVGYELIGESFWYGSQDIVKTFSNFFSTNFIFKMLVNFPSKYIQHVAGGFEYMKQDAQQNSFAGAFIGFANIIDQTGSNITSNVSSISNTVGTISGGVFAYMGSLFEFNLIEKEEKIKKIKIEN